MTRQLKLGLALPSTEQDRVTTWEEIRDIALRAEAAGFDSVWHADHLFIQWEPGNRQGRLECWTIMTALAVATSRVRIGSLVLCQSYRDPAILAKMAGTLQEIAAGRLILGVGAGWHEPEYRAFGLPYNHLASRFTEYLEVLAPMLRNQTVTYSGNYHSVEDVQLVPPAPHVPIWVGSAKERMHGLTGKWADGWNTAWFGADPSVYFGRMKAVREAVERAGRDPNALEYSVGVTINPVQSEADIPARLQEIRDKTPMFRGLNDEQLKRRIAVGTPKQIADILRAYHEGGADTIMLSPSAIAMSLWSQEALDLTIDGVKRELQG